MKLIIDRIEENIAVMELPSGEYVNIPKVLIEDAREGDSIVITVEKKTKEQESDTHSIFERLRNKSN